MLKSRKYNKNVVKAAIKKALEKNRQEALKKVDKKKEERVVFALTYHPKLPSISKIMKTHWKTMIRNPESKDTFKKPPMVAYKQPPNLQRLLCKAKLPSKRHEKRRKTGLQRCYKPCDICPYVLNSKEYSSNKTKEKYQMKGFFTCNTQGIVYLISCTKCNMQYVGQTGRKLVDRIKEHIYYIGKKKEATGTHFSTNNHNNSDFRVQVIEKVIPNAPQMRLDREDFWIRTLNTKSPSGLNKND